MTRVVQMYFRIAAASQSSALDLSEVSMWANFDPAIAPSSQRKKSVVATEGTFLL